MMKKMMVLAGMAAMLLCGCVKEETTTETKVETVGLVDKNIKAIEESNDKLFDAVTNMYIEAALEIYGDDCDVDKIECNIEGLTYEGRFVSWEYLEEYAYNSMVNE